MTTTAKESIAMTKKQVRFGGITYCADGQEEEGRNSWWDAEELTRLYEHDLHLARYRLPGSDRRGLEDHFQKDFDTQLERNALFVKYVVRRFKKLNKMPPRSRDIAIQMYASKHTEVQQIRAQEKAIEDEKEASRIHGLHFNRSTGMETSAPATPSPQKRCLVSVAA